MRKPKPSPRRPKPKKCVSRTILSDELVAWSRKGTDDANRIRRLTEDRDSLAETSSANLGAYMQAAAERDESRKQHLVATQRNVELTGELNAANAALQQYVTSYQTYVGRIKEADRTLAQMENQRRAEDAKNCLQWWHCSSTMTIFLAIP